MSCPTCGKPADPKYRPFCSRRCADVDLARWLNESYRIPDAAAGDDEPPEDPAPPTPH
ncbi:DNA gyrase inhibitor YacG [Rhodobacter sp. Har01]|uniref:DNA gyrase inhibitor YacG n=1 Tax=Rhodobacter sp. Har01 TaxID=2883999 RepID=UPI001D06FCFE|nr:DNA gyrase inhibitor YacG [Rhodobacter sp. Har01]MCB6178929.1 DNA gyrase inhibitor YacG [Rhodobacter sp. Har01]